MNSCNKIVTFVVIIVSLLLSAPVLADDAVWIDVRSEQEYQTDHLQGAEFIPHTQIGEEIGKLNLAKDTPIKLFCRSGHRAGIALETLRGMGYTNVKNVGGIAEARQLMSEN